MGASFTQAVLGEHLVSGEMSPGCEIGIRVDQVLIQDHSGPQTLLHFEALGLDRVRCETAVCYSDHNVLQLRPENMQDHFYLQSAAKKYGLWFAKPGTGICHQLHLDEFAVPCKSLLGADSHTPLAGALGMLAFGAGGMDVAAVLAGAPFHFKMPGVVAVRLRGRLPAWTSAKDVALELLRRLGVRGAFGQILEFTGPGAKTFHIQQRATITNMCTELGAMTGVFPSDELTLHFLRHRGREDAYRGLPPHDDAKYDGQIDVNLSDLEPLVALPGSPDRVVPVREVSGTEIRQVMVGSCTNGSYADLETVATMLAGQRVHPDVLFFVHPSSVEALCHLAGEGLLADLLQAGVEVCSPTCGACIGLGHVPAPGTNSLRTINRNFQGRSGQPDDAVFLCSSETAAASAVCGVITDPRQFARERSIPCRSIGLPPVTARRQAGLIPPAEPEEAERLGIERGDNLVPAPSKRPLSDRIPGVVLLKLGDQVTTDHIMPATPESLAYRSNVPRISQFVFGRVDPDFAARAQENSGGWIVAGENYGQGSSREHAALAPMYLGIHGVLASSFARIHHDNLVNCGLLPLVFDDPADRHSVEQGDRLAIECVHRGLATSRMQVRNETNGKAFTVRLELSERQKAIARTGGLLPFTRSAAATRPDRTA